MSTPPNPPEGDLAARGSADPARPVPTKGDAARHAYVTGLAATIAEAAAVAGITESHAMALSSRDGWVEARKAYLERERAALANESAEGEARIQAVARRLAWRVAWKGLLRVEARVDDPSKSITGYEVEALVRAAMALSGVGDQQADEAVQRIRRRPMREVAVEFLAVLKTYGVDSESLGEMPFDGASGGAPRPVAVDPVAPPPAPAVENRDADKT